ncbi:MAG: hypothetical protein BYD32DRAFT_419427 [Podila humilis]|nr:MAG: hypothetical protein BYD32DRAFT_419427 [Podila humilis]
MDVTRLVEANNEAGTVIAVSSTSPSLSSLGASSGAGNSGTTTTAAVEHPLEDTTPTTSGSPSCPCDPTNTNTTTIISNTVNLNSTIASPSMASSPATYTRERSAASTPSNLSFREGYTNHNNNTNNITHVTIGQEANQQPPSPMARPRSVQPQSPLVSNSEHLPLHILAERRPRPTESIISSMSHSSSRIRVRPLSVTIDLSSVDPPAYEPSSLSSTQESQLGQRSQQHHRISMVPSLAGSMATSIQQEQNLRPPSIYSANTSAVGSTRAGPVVTPLHSTAGTEGVSVVISPSMSAPRRPFLEEDELPEYITLSENGPPFKIPASESITYTVTPSQGPEEFQQQFQDEIVIHQPASRRRTAGLDRNTSLSFSGTYDHGRGASEPETTLHTRRGAWTLEYWVNDTIMYLCYLMDPKHSTTTALVPRRLVPDTLITSVTDETRRESNRQTTTNAPAPAPTPVLINNRESGDLFNAFMTPETNPEDETEASNEEQTTMERVPTGHLRGRPPPLTRPRIQQPYHRFVSTELSRTVNARYRVGGSRALATAVTARPRRVQTVENRDVSSSTPVSGSAVVPVEEEQNDPVATEENQEESDVVAEEPSGDAPTETSVVVDPVETEQISEIDNPVDDASPIQPPQSPRQQHLPLPPIHPLPEDQPTNDILPTQPEHTLFNNALTAEFFKNPTYALVSAEDPQTWIWWSTHHEQNLQRSRQEGPNEEVLMWWRTRTDSNTKENKEKRKRLKQWQQWQAREVALAQQQRREMRRQARQGARLEGGGEGSSSRVRSHRRSSQSQSQNGYQTHSTATQLSSSSSSTQRKSDKNKKSKNKKPRGTLSERFFALLESKFPSAPHNETMEITMRVRGLYYAWREDDCGALPPLSSATSTRYGTQSDVHELRRHHRHRPHHRHSRDNQYYQEDLQEDTGPSSTPPPPLTPLSPSPIPPPQPHPRTHTSSSLPLLHHLKSRPRMFTLVRDDSLVMGQRVKGGPVAEIWIGDDSDPSMPLHEYFATTTTYASMLSEEVAPSSLMHHGIEGVMPSSASMSTPGSTTTPYYAYMSGGGGVTSDGASSITSNNGNTFMTEVSVATGGPMRSSTVASTFMAPVPSGRSFASSMAGRYNVSMGSPAPASMASLGSSDDEDDEEEDEEDEDEGGEEGEEDIEGYPQYHGPGGHNEQHGSGSRGEDRMRRRRRAGSFSSSTSSLSHVMPSSSFPPSLLRRKCVIRVLRGLSPEVETFALSTGPRLPELFELYTDQSLPGPSRGTFICSIITFAVLFSAAFIGVAVSKTGGP